MQNSLGDSVLVYPGEAASIVKEAPHDWLQAQDSTRERKVSCEKNSSVLEPYHLGATLGQNVGKISRS
jgi:hypothetical protein